jgi:AraC family transcriptional regulator, transcriptional activator of pobA
MAACTCHHTNRTATIGLFDRMNTIPLRRLSSRRSLQLSEDFNIRSIADVLAGKDMVQELHRHDHYFLLAITKGRGMHECDFRLHTLAAHTIYAMRPGQVHRLKLQAGCTGYILQFKAGFLATSDASTRQVLRRAGHVEVLRVGAKRHTELLVLLDRIARECAERQKDHLQVVRAYLTAFLTELALRAPLSANADKTNGYAEERLEELLELIESRVHDTKEVSAYAGLMHLSSYQLNAIAKAGTGRTCSELITDQIILEAKRYLLATTDQVSQVADHLGYDDVSYFIRFFKRHTGHTPEVFRKKSR